MEQQAAEREEPVGLSDEVMKVAAWKLVVLHRELRAKGVPKRVAAEAVAHAAPVVLEHVARQPM